MITVKEYAEQNNHSVDFVMGMIDNGTLSAEEREAIWYVDPLSENTSSGHEKPSVVDLLNILSLIVLILGIGMALEFWPEYSSDLEDLIRPIIWLTAGIVQSILFAALAKAITYLSKIEFNTRKI